jgi:hypothetical protein
MTGERLKARLVYEQIDKTQDTNCWAIDAATDGFRNNRLAFGIVCKCNLEIH